MASLADPSTNINRDGTVKERDEGTLTKCKCGVEFFLSFKDGFMCSGCIKKHNKSLKEKIKKFALDAKREINENKHKRNKLKE